MSQLSRRLMLLGLIPGVAQARDRDSELILQLDREVIALKQRIKAMQDQLDHCGDTPGIPPIYTELLQILSGGPATLTRDGITVSITLLNEFVFVSNEARIREEAIPILDLVATALKLHNVQVTLHCHSDSALPPTSARKYFPTNWEWTSLLAATLVRTFIDKFALPPSRLSACGHADAQPAVGPENVEARKLNPRLVIEITPIPIITVPPTENPWGN